MWPDDSGSWALGDAYAQPITSDTVTGDAASASQAVDNSGTGSSWTGFLQKTIGTVVSAGLQKASAQSASQLAQQRAQALATTPLVSTSGNTLGVSSMGLLLIGGVVLAVVLSHKG